MAGRLISAANILVAMPLRVPYLPDRGGAVGANFTGFEVSGAFSVLSAAARQGVEVINACPIGTGTNSVLVRQALASEGITSVCSEVLGDNGTAMVLLEEDGHYTSVISKGVEAEPLLADLRKLEIREDDWLYLSGIDFTDAAAATILTQWLRELPATTKIAFAPTPMVQEIAPVTLERILRRVDCLTLNAREGDKVLLMVGLQGETIWEAMQRLLKPECILVRRQGAADCLVSWGEREHEIPIKTFPRKVIDTSGVGDSHTGVLLANLLQGKDIETAVLRANAAASITVGRMGTAKCPRAAEIDQVCARGYV